MTSHGTNSRDSQNNTNVSPTVERIVQSFCDRLLPGVLDYIEGEMNTVLKGGQTQQATGGENQFLVALPLEMRHTTVIAALIGGRSLTFSGFLVRGLLEDLGDEYLEQTLEQLDGWGVVNVVVYGSKPRYRLSLIGECIAMQLVKEIGS